jgi:hypothetical protein
MFGFYKRATLTLAATLLLSAVSTSALALDDRQLYLIAKGDIPWQSLSPDEQNALEDYRIRWNDYDTDKQNRIREGAHRYLSMPPEKRRELNRQRDRYERLSPEEKRRLKKQYQRDRH